MTNTRLFREYISSSGYKLGAVASAAGLTYQGFINKMNNDNEFKASEIKAISAYTHMPDTTRDAIFFA